MKRNVILVMSLIAALAVTACGSKQTENVQTQAATQAAAETQAAAAETKAAAEAVALDEKVLAEIPEDFDEEYFEGVVTGFDGTIAELTNEDGTKMSFDISGSERLDEGLFMEGAYAEIGYATLADGKVAALDVNLLMDIEQQASIEGRDPYIAGTIQFNDINDLELIDQNGVERDFDNSMARTVSFHDLKPGDKVYVTYVGSLLSEEEEDAEYDEANPIRKPITIKIVAEDALGSEEATANYLTGQVDSISAGEIELMTDSIEFQISGPEDLFKDIAEEDFVKVYYDGALNGIMVDATKIEKQ